jgi:hypothetical protein
LNGIDQFIVPATCSPDTLCQQRSGVQDAVARPPFRTQWCRLSGEFKNAQGSFFDPQSGRGNIIILTNGPNYQVRGAELQLVAEIAAG